MKSSQKFMMASLATLVAGSLVFLGYRKVSGVKRNEKEDLKKDLEKGESNDKTPVELGKTSDEPAARVNTVSEVDSILETGVQIRTRLAGIARAIIQGEYIDNKDILNAEDFLAVFVRNAMIVYMQNEEALEQLPRSVEDMYNFLDTVSLRADFTKLVKKNRYAHGFRGTIQPKQTLKRRDINIRRPRSSVNGGGEKTTARVEQ